MIKPDEQHQPSVPEKPSDLIVEDIKEISDFLDSVESRDGSKQKKSDGSNNV